MSACVNVPPSPSTVLPLSSSVPIAAAAVMV